MKGKDTIQNMQMVLLTALGERTRNQDPIGWAKVDTIDFFLGEGDVPVEGGEPPKTDADLDALIHLLKRERGNIPEYSHFGDPNWKIIDAQIQMCKWAKGAE